jgi:hypothetical protein
MLNRKNLTLSALSNRLNLGTRSLVLNASVNLGGNTLRIRHAHHDAMREAMQWYGVKPFKQGKYDLPPIHDSIIPIPPQRPVRHVPEGSSHPASAACPDRSHSRSSHAGFAGRTAGGRASLDPSPGLSTAVLVQGVAFAQRPGRCERSAAMGRRGFAARREAAAPAAAAIAARAES